VTSVQQRLRRLMWRRRVANPDGTMTLIEHLTELRNRLFKSAVFVVLGMIVGWFLYGPILRIMQKPYCALPADKRFPPNTPGCTLVFFGVGDGFVIRIKVVFIAALVLSAPFWLYQLWAFITPGLKKNERKWTMIFVSSASILFALGMSAAYLILPKALHVLVGLAGPGVTPLFAVKDYLSFIMSMLLIFGVAFELPLLVVILNLAGILSYARLMKWQRMSIFLIFVFAAVATPSQDPLSMMFMAVPLCILFEGAVLVARFHDKRKAQREALESYENIPDDEASPLDLRPSSVDGPSDVDPATPLDSHQDWT
jgi:sec-independent protein translocase protein TatC